jgi:hypothetical protein
VYVDHFLIAYKLDMSLEDTIPLLEDDFKIKNLGQAKKMLEWNIEIDNKKIKVN